jgi:hypothetical protein
METKSIQGKWCDGLLELFRSAEIFVAAGRSAAVLAYKTRVAHQVFVLLQVGLHISHVLEIAQVFFVSGMGHLGVSHYFSPFVFELRFYVGSPLQQGTKKRPQRPEINLVLVR